MVLAEDETRLNLLPHVRASRTLRAARPKIHARGTNRQMTVFGAVDVSTGLISRAWAEVVRIAGGRMLHADPHPSR